MGLRGPIRDPESRRGAAEGLTVLPVHDHRQPTPPSYLSAKEKSLFATLVDEASRASLSPLLVDAHLYAKIARMELMLEKEQDVDRFLKVMRTLLACYQSAGMTEVARRRLGIRVENKKRGTVSSILEAKRAI
jgi:hypothetical protein